MQLLLQNGASPDYSSFKLGMTPLHWACYHGDVGVVQALMKVDASHEYNREGNLPVDVAGFMKRQAVVECICEGLSKRILNEANQTAGSVF